jgi:hypothetical protein
MQISLAWGLCVFVYAQNCSTQLHSLVKVLLLVGRIAHNLINSCILLAGGNQRELARAKNQKKLQDAQRKKGGGEKEAGAMTLEQRKHR